MYGFQKNVVPKQSTALQQQQHQRFMSAFPSMIVFDLDNTIWTPELYQLRTHERSGITPVAGKHVRLFEGSQAIIDAIRRGDYPTGTKFAVASRTKSVEWAHDLLEQFRLRELLDYVEIFPGNKQLHFTNLKKASGIDYHQMLFFDDARDGKYGNCVPVSNMGVLAVHCPDGLTCYSIFENALKNFEKWNKSPSTIIEHDGSITCYNARSNERLEGVVKKINAQKRYGFISYGELSQLEVFFHFNNLPTGLSASVGDKVSFSLEQDSNNGKNFANDLLILSSNNQKKISMNAFSMNLPFAALLANGYKTLETRNGTMFVPYPEGTQMLLHVGHRTYPDGGKHIDLMKSEGLNDDDVQRLRSLPMGYSKGMIVAICEIGETYETSTAERSVRDFERKVVAYGLESGRMVTEIKRVAYLKRPFQVSGQRGVFQVDIDPCVLPEGWELRTAAHGGARTDSNRMNKPIYSITG